VIYWRLLDLTREYSYYLNDGKGGRVLSTGIGMPAQIVPQFTCHVILAQILRHGLDEMEKICPF